MCVCVGARACVGVHVSTCRCVYWCVCRCMYVCVCVGVGFPRQFVYEHFVYDTSSTDISSTDILSTTVYQRTGQLYIQLLFQQIIIFINSSFYLHYDLFLSIPLLVRKNSLH